MAEFLFLRLPQKVREWVRLGCCLECAYVCSGAEAPPPGQEPPPRLSPDQLDSLGTALPPMLAQLLYPEGLSEQELAAARFGNEVPVYRCPRMADQAQEDEGLACLPLRGRNWCSECGCNIAVYLFKPAGQMESEAAMCPPCWVALRDQQQRPAGAEAAAEAAGGGGEGGGGGGGGKGRGKGKAGGDRSSSGLIAAGMELYCCLRPEMLLRLQVLVPRPQPPTPHAPLQPQPIPLPQPPPVRPSSQPPQPPQPPPAHSTGPRPSSGRLQSQGPHGTAAEPAAPPEAAAAATGRQPVLPAASGLGPEAAPLFPLPERSGDGDTSQGVAATQETPWLLSPSDPSPAAPCGLSAHAGHVAVQAGGQREDEQQRWTAAAAAAAAAAAMEVMAGGRAAPCLQLSPLTSPAPPPSVAALPAPPSVAALPASPSVAALPAPPSARAIRAPERPVYDTLPTQPAHPLPPSHQEWHYHHRHHGQHLQHQHQSAVHPTWASVQGLPPNVSYAAWEVHQRALAERGLVAPPPHPHLHPAPQVLLTRQPAPHRPPQALRWLHAVPCGVSDVMLAPAHQYMALGGTPYVHTLPRACFSAAEGSSEFVMAQRVAASATAALPGTAAPALPVLRRPRHGPGDCHEAPEAGAAAAAAASAPPLSLAAPHHRRPASARLGLSPAAGAALALRNNQMTELLRAQYQSQGGGTAAAAAVAAAAAGSVLGTDPFASAHVVAAGQPSPPPALLPPALPSAPPQAAAPPRAAAHNCGAGAGGCAAAGTRAAPMDAVPHLADGLPSHRHTAEAGTGAEPTPATESLGQRPRPSSLTRPRPPPPQQQAEPNAEREGSSQPEPQRGRDQGVAAAAAAAAPHAAAAAGGGGGLFPSAAGPRLSCPAYKRRIDLPGLHPAVALGLPPPPPPAAAPPAAAWYDMTARTADVPYFEGALARSAPLVRKAGEALVEEDYCYTVRKDAVARLPERKRRELLLLTREHNARGGTVLYAGPMSALHDPGNLLSDWLDANATCVEALRAAQAKAARPPAAAAAMAGQSRGGAAAGSTGAGAAPLRGPFPWTVSNYEWVKPVPGLAPGCSPQDLSCAAAVAPAGAAAAVAAANAGSGTGAAHGAGPAAATAAAVGAGASTGADRHPSEAAPAAAPAAAVERPRDHAYTPFHLCCVDMAHRHEFDLGPVSVTASFEKYRGRSTGGHDADYKVTPEELLTHMRDMVDRYAVQTDPRVGYLRRQFWEVRPRAAATPAQLAAAAAAAAATATGVEGRRRQAPPAAGARVGAEEGDKALQLAKARPAPAAPLPRELLQQAAPGAKRAAAAAALPQQGPGASKRGPGAAAAAAAAGGGHGDGSDDDGGDAGDGSRVPVGLKVPLYPLTAHDTLFMHSSDLMRLAHRTLLMHGPLWLRDVLHEKQGDALEFGSCRPTDGGLGVFAHFANMLKRPIQAVDLATGTHVDRSQPATLMCFAVPFAVPRNLHEALGKLRHGLHDHRHALWLQSRNLRDQWRLQHPDLSQTTAAAAAAAAAAGAEPQPLLNAAADRAAKRGSVWVLVPGNRLHQLAHALQAGKSGGKAGRRVWPRNHDGFWSQKWVQEMDSLIRACWTHGVPFHVVYHCEGDLLLPGMAAAHAVMPLHCASMKISQDFLLPSGPALSLVWELEALRQEQHLYWASDKAKRYKKPVPARAVKPEAEEWTAIEAEAEAAAEARVVAARGPAAAAEAVAAEAGQHEAGAAEEQPRDEEQEREQTPAPAVQQQRQQQVAKQAARRRPPRQAAGAAELGGRGARGRGRRGAAAARARSPAAAGTAAEGPAPLPAAEGLEAPPGPADEPARATACGAAVAPAPSEARAEAGVGAVAQREAGGLAAGGESEASAGEEASQARVPPCAVGAEGGAAEGGSSRRPDPWVAPAAELVPAPAEEVAPTPAAMVPATAVLNESSYGADILAPTQELRGQQLEEGDRALEAVRSASPATSVAEAVVAPASSSPAAAGGGGAEPPAAVQAVAAPEIEAETWSEPAEAPGDASAVVLSEATAVVSGRAAGDAGQEPAVTLPFPADTAPEAAPVSGEAAVAGGAAMAAATDGELVTAGQADGRPHADGEARRQAVPQPGADDEARQQGAPPPAGSAAAPAVSAPHPVARPLLPQQLAHAEPQADAAAPPPSPAGAGPAGTPAVASGASCGGPDCAAAAAAPDGCCATATAAASGPSAEEASVPARVGGYEAHGSPEAVAAEGAAESPCAGATGAGPSATNGASGPEPGERPGAGPDGRAPEEHKGSCGAAPEYAAGRSARRGAGTQEASALLGLSYLDSEDESDNADGTVVGVGGDEADAEARSIAGSGETAPPPPPPPTSSVPLRQQQQQEAAAAAAAGCVAAGCAAASGAPLQRAHAGAAQSPGADGSESSPPDGAAGDRAPAAGAAAAAAAAELGMDTGTSAAEASEAALASAGSGAASGSPAASCACEEVVAAVGGAAATAAVLAAESPAAEATCDSGVAVRAESFGEADVAAEAAGSSVAAANAASRAAANAVGASPDAGDAAAAAAAAMRARACSGMVQAAAGACGMEALPMLDLPERTLPTRLPVLEGDCVVTEVAPDPASEASAAPHTASGVELAPAATAGLGVLAACLPNSRAEALAAEMSVELAGAEADICSPCPAGGGPADGFAVGSCGGAGAEAPSGTAVPEGTTVVVDKGSGAGPDLTTAMAEQEAEPGVDAGAGGDGVRPVGPRPPPDWARLALPLCDTVDWDMLLQLSLSSAAEGGAPPSPPREGPPCDGNPSLWSDIPEPATAEPPEPEMMDWALAALQEGVPDARDALSALVGLAAAVPTAPATPLSSDPAASPALVTAAAAAAAGTVAAAAAAITIAVAAAPCPASPVLSVPGESLHAGAASGECDAGGLGAWHGDGAAIAGLRDRALPGQRWRLSPTAYSSAGPAVSASAASTAAAVAPAGEATATSRKGVHSPARRPAMRRVSDLYRQAGQSYSQQEAPPQPAAAQQDAPRAALAAAEPATRPRAAYATRQRQAPQLPPLPPLHRTQPEPASRRSLSRDRSSGAATQPEPQPQCEEGGNEDGQEDVPLALLHSFAGPNATERRPASNPSQEATRAKRAPRGTAAAVSAAAAAAAAAEPPAPHASVGAVIQRTAAAAEPAAHAPVAAAARKRPLDAGAGGGAGASAASSQGRVAAGPSAGVAKKSRGGGAGRAGKGPEAKAAGKKRKAAAAAAVDYDAMVSEAVADGDEPQGGEDGEREDPNKEEPIWKMGLEHSKDAFLYQSILVGLGLAVSYTRCHLELQARRGAAAAARAAAAAAASGAQEPWAPME